MTNQAKGGTPIVQWSISHLNDIAREGVVWDESRLDPLYEEELADGEETVVWLCRNGEKVRDVNFVEHYEAEKFAAVADEFLPDTVAMEDEDFGTALKAYRAWCERNGYIYQQPARDVSGWLGDYVSLRNGGGQLALLHVDEQGVMQVVFDYETA